MTIYDRVIRRITDQGGYSANSQHVDLIHMALDAAKEVDRGLEMIEVLLPYLRGEKKKDEAFEDLLIEIAEKLADAKYGMK